MSKDLPEGLAFKEELNLYRYCNGNLNFSTVSHDDEDYGYQKKKIMRDPMSHRIIEKRRRDRMNNCLADLSRLIPPDYLKKGRGRIEKTEIIEMAIKHMRHLQNIIASSRANEGQCEIAAGSSPDGSSSREFVLPTMTSHQPIIVEHYRLGYLECLSEAMHFLVEVQGYFAGDSLCVQMINHLHKHCDKILKSDSLNHPIKHNGETSSNSSVSPTNANYSNNSPPLGLSASNGSNSDDNQPSHPFENGRTFEPIDDPLRNVGFRSPRRYSDMSSRDSKKACEPYYPRYSEPESERISENPSDSDVEQGYAGGARNKDARAYLNGYEDAPQCSGVDCLPMNCSSSSGIGSNPGYTPPYDEFLAKEENGPSQLRDMLTSPKVAHGNGIHPVRVSEVKRSVSPTPQHFGSETSPVHQNSNRQESNASDERQMDAVNYKAQDLTVEAESGAIQELHHENSENNIPDTHGNMYKFKNNIKQRFSKERKNHDGDEEVFGKRVKLSEVTLCENDPMGRKCDSLMKERLSLLNKVDVDCNTMKRNRYLSESEMRIQSDNGDLSNRLSFGHKTGNRSKKWDESLKYSRLKLSPQYVTPEMPIEYRAGEDGRKPIGLLAITEYISTDQSALQRYGTGANDSGIGVPIFALHSKGSFYVPLTLDQSILTPFLSLLGLTKTEEVDEKPILHPVTISVNFQASYLAKTTKQGAIQ